MTLNRHWFAGREPTSLATTPQPILEGQSATSAFIPNKNALQIMRPARGVHDALSTDMIVTSVAVALQQTLEVAQEPSGTFPFPAKPEVKHHQSTRPAVLPEVSLVIFAPTIVHLHSDGCFIGLDIGTPLNNSWPIAAVIGRSNSPT